LKVSGQRIELLRRTQSSRGFQLAFADHVHQLPLTDRRELVRHYTLSDADVAMIRRCRGDQSRLGYALMLCYLRYPGRPLHANERPPATLVLFVADQIVAIRGAFTPDDD
jgi:TnpA family transposase